MAPRIFIDTLQTKLAAHRRFLRDIHGGNRLVLKLHDAADPVFSKHNLSWAELAGTNLSRCIFYEASMVGISLFAAVLKGADLRGADLSKANFRGITLH